MMAPKWVVRAGSTPGSLESWVLLIVLMALSATPALAVYLWNNR